KRRPADPERALREKLPSREKCGAVCERGVHESSDVRVGVLPALSRSAKSCLVFRPVVQRSRIEVSPARPDNRMNLRIKSDLRKHSRVTERTIKFALQ